MLAGVVVRSRAGGSGALGGPPSASGLARAARAAFETARDPSGVSTRTNGHRARERPSRRAAWRFSATTGPRTRNCLSGRRPAHPSAGPGRDRRRQDRSHDQPGGQHPAVGIGVYLCRWQGDARLWTQIPGDGAGLRAGDDVQVLNFLTGSTDVDPHGPGARGCPTPSTHFLHGSADAITQLLIAQMAEAGGDSATWKDKAIGLLTAYVRTLVAMGIAGATNKSPVYPRCRRVAGPSAPWIT